jgi:Cytochrome P450
MQKPFLLGKFKKGTYLRVAAARRLAGSERPRGTPTSHGEYQGIPTLHTRRRVIDTHYHPRRCRDIGPAQSLHIPGGTAVGKAILHVHQSVEIWGEDALGFRPERWLEGNDEAYLKGQAANCAHSSLRKDLDQWLVPFSRGPRMCSGVNLAWAELYIAFATMIRCFDLAIDGTTQENMEWRGCIAAYYPKRHLHAWCKPVKFCMKASLGRGTRCPLFIGVSVYAHFSHKTQRWI